MKISNSKKLTTLYKKDLAAAKFETLLIMGFILVGNLFLYYKAKTSWPIEISLVFSTLILGFVPLSTFFRAFSFIRSEWKENTVYFMMSLPTTGNVIFLAKLLALLTQFFLLGAIALIFTGTFVFMHPQFQHIWVVIKDISTTPEIIWEMSKIGILLFVGFGLSIIIAFLSAVIGKLFKKFSGLITFVAFIAINYGTSAIIVKLLELVNTPRFNSYMQKSMMIDGANVTWQLTPGVGLSGVDFSIISILLIGASVLLFLGTTAIYDRKVEL